MRVLQESELRWVGGGYDSDGPQNFDEAADEAVWNIMGLGHDIFWNETQYGQSMYGMDVVAEVYGGTNHSVIAVDEDGRIWGDSDGNGYADTELFETYQGLQADTNADGSPDTVVTGPY